MADLARELEDFINTKFLGPVNSMSKGMRHILLLYHEVCIPSNKQNSELTQNTSVSSWPHDPYF